MAGSNFPYYGVWLKLLTVSFCQFPSIQYTGTKYVYYSFIAGDPEAAKQVILSILHHVSDNHVFPSLPLFSKCGHGPIEQEKEWIKPGSVALERLREAVLGRDGRNLADVEYMSGRNVSEQNLTYKNAFSRILPYRRYRVCQCPPFEVCQENSHIQVNIPLLFSHIRTSLKFYVITAGWVC